MMTASCRDACYKSQRSRFIYTFRTDAVRVAVVSSRPSLIFAYLVRSRALPRDIIAAFNRAFRFAVYPALDRGFFFFTGPGLASGRSARGISHNCIANTLGILWPLRHRRPGRKTNPLCHLRRVQISRR